MSAACSTCAIPRLPSKPSGARAELKTASSVLSGMEPSGHRHEDGNKGVELPERKAAQRTSAPGAAVAPRRGLRERPATRTASGDSAVNGSGRVLRDRSTRAVPAWLKDNKSDEDRDERRRKLLNSRRRKAEAGDGVHSADEAKTAAADAEAPLSWLSPAQSAAKPPSGRAARCSAKPLCKTELGIENQAGERPVDGEANIQEKYDINGEEKREAVRSQCVDKRDPQFQGDPSDLNTASASQPQGEADEEEVISSDEDVPFRDDLNDQSYDPKAERFLDAPKPKRRLPLRQKDKREKEKAPKKEEVEEIKMEGSDNLGSPEMEVKREDDLADDPDGPRKRGRRKKDDKTPRLPKRRKKPPVQYVRCEMEGCGTVLAHPRYLQHHIKYQHLLKKKYVCPHPSCGRLFRLQKQLLRHAKHHTDQRDYICEFCARAFKSSHNLAVHRMIHTGEKPLQCEICGFTCRQKASLNWHMKKHDADASYQFSCSICGKKFEKKDCVVAHKAKSHPEVLIAEALAANAGALITTPATSPEPPAEPVRAEVGGGDCREGQAQPAGREGRVGSRAAQVSRMSHVTPQVGQRVVLLGQEQALHTVQVPVTIALSPVDPPPPADHRLQTQVQLQMPVQFIQQPPQFSTHSPSAQRQSRLRPLQSYSSQRESQGQILQMSFQPVSQSQTPPQTTDSGPPLLSPPQPQEASNSETFCPDNPATAPSSPPANSFRPIPTEGAGGAAWEQISGGDALSNSTEGDA
ncbi:E3 ubiquitin-protein ligase ZFP91 isoform X2 [Phyllopteryx taeniolatus]|uniref:E3 ubiquitin-protein ligase ZFP91 isoform X2 n=1 Tax=Phyllopteryx taeniolatus TaxID=161469 RepID=UPI002AD2DB84|nr:E3 ubiquitin-protein ligase ZFP91 isoform X2 [Phyllopteryx taeniolatus]